MSQEIPQNAIGILAYGSLIYEPGREIDPHITERIPCKTPFNVEYGRVSKTRDNAPTLIPMKEGGPVDAMILVLDSSVTQEEAASLLWRRETRMIGTDLPYVRPKKITQDTVTVEKVENLFGVTTVFYTKIDSNLGVFLDAKLLASHAIKSALSQAGADGNDGITYLAANIKNGIHTPMTEAYVAEILAQTSAADLTAAAAMLAHQRPAQIKKKVDWDNFEQEVREISDFMHEYGLKTTLPADWSDDQNLQTFIKENYDQFIINCHTGFKIAQDRVLNFLLARQDRALGIKEELKTAHSNKKKNRVAQLQVEKKELDFKEKVLRHLMDSLVWQLMGGQLYVSRQLYKNVKDVRSLRSSNIESLKLAASHLNEKAEDFALISDLTSYVQVGDLLWKKDGNVAVVEVKEGEKNDKHYKIIEEMGTPGMTPEELVKKHQLSKKDVEQVTRQLRQLVEMENLSNIINHDEGVNLATGGKVTIVTPEEPTPFFTDRFAAMYNQLQERNLWAYDVIDECLHIGMYKDLFRFGGPKLLKAIATNKGFKHIIVDIRSVLDSLNKPMFALPFPKDFIFDVLFGRVHIYFMLDLDNYMALAPHFGLKAEWVSRAETHKIKEKVGQKNLFLYENRAIKMAIDAPADVTLPEGTEFYVSTGLLSKMFFEHIHPAYTMYSHWYYFRQVIEVDTKDNPERVGSTAGAQSS